MAGSILITLALVMSLFSMVMYYFNYRGMQNAVKYARLGYHGMVMLIIVASTYLSYLIITHQYQYTYVYNYSNSDLPIGLLISTFWAGQEGSFMLWTLMTVIIGVFLQSYSEKRGDLEPRVMMVYALATSFLILMVSPLMKNPFALQWQAHDPFIAIAHINQQLLNAPFVVNFLYGNDGGNPTHLKFDSEFVGYLQGAGYSVSEVILFGKGLNPLLQNFWMQIHPPILFVGFSMATVPFAFAIAALLKNDYKDWVRQSFPWMLAGAGVLGLGIMLGGYWAYGVLGWGGYWAWDPVENSSLVPWLVSVAAVHTFIVQRRSQKLHGGPGKFARTNLIFSILIYVLVLYSTFLTRSGILGDASVHSFVSPGKLVYFSLLFFLLAFMLLGVGMVIWRWKSLDSNVPEEESVLSRELSLFTAAVVIGASALIVLTGTSAPIFGGKVEIEFYNEMHLPLAIIIGFMNGLSLLLKWKSTKKEDLMKSSFLSLGLSVAATLIAMVWGGIYDIMLLLLTFSAFFALIVNAEIAFRIIKGKKSMLGAYVAHIGIALFILGVVGSAGFSDQKELILVKDKPVEAFGYQVTFKEIIPYEEANTTKYRFKIDVVKNDNVSSVKPIMYLSEFNGSLMREPDMLKFWTKDFYVEPLGYDQAGAHDHASDPKSVTIMPGEAQVLDNAKIEYLEFIKPDMAAMTGDADFKMGIVAEINKDGNIVKRELIFKRVNNEMVYEVLDIPELNMKLQLSGLDAASKRVTIVSLNQSGDGHDHSTDVQEETLTVVAYVKPFIGLVWLGTVVVTFGFFVSVYRRLHDTKNKEK